MSTSGDTVSADPSRNERTAARVQRLGKRADRGLERWLLIIGGVLLPLGLMLVVMGWIGAAQTPLLFEQIPYLISGGLLGLGLVFTGGFVYFAYWHTVVIRDARAQSKELTQALGRIEGLLAAGAGMTATGGINGSSSTNLVTTESGTMFHRRDCPIVVNRENLRPVTAEEPGLRPCSICNPLALAVNN